MRIYFDFYGDFKKVDLEESDNDFITAQDGSKRYYYYLVFEIGSSQDNNNIYATIKGNNQSESKRTKFFDATWKQDNTAPTIDSGYLNNSKFTKFNYINQNDFELVSYSRFAQTYIMFDKEYDFKSLPDGFTYANNQIEHLTYFYDGSARKSYEEIENEINECIIILEKWVEKLPIKKGND